ncbi:coiled-coil domain-containing protein [Roseimaritima ulvae]|uniref:Uncharacterized protein n=1 Tax=Roseimaritima ulvae TaxID=980254 RepID=A0A5B9QRD1_9BACT|nr:hypothetical protein [Roseimaritima ulvae]QEG41554.1 hypothetical protein UC8_35780 [Roseimaritima ulvae]
MRPAAAAAVAETTSAEPVVASDSAAEDVATERGAVELDQQLATISELLRRSVSDETRLEAREQQLREREAELQRRSDDLEHRRREHARRVRQHRQLANVQQSLAEQADGFTDLLAVLADNVARQSESMHEHDREAIEDLQALAAEVELKQQTIDCLKTDLDAEQQRNRELQAELDQHLCERLFDTPSLQSQDETLEQELDEARARLAELEQQNQELATKLAAHSVRGEIATSTGAVTESMSWEERKKLILQRLENEDQSLAHGDFGDADAVRDELQSLRAMVQTTDKEIARRDSEIAELRQLLEQQSNTVGDVAIGAAAIAGLLDQDDLVREEREKLQQIQTEWQDKLRQAEIEVSLERARLARERQEIEKRNVELKDRMLERPGGAAREEELDANGKPARKWLAKLGLDK